MNFLKDGIAYFCCLYFLILFSLSGWAWFRGRLYMPGYVHVLAAGLTLAGIAFMMFLPEPTNPDPVVRALVPFIIPVVLVIAVYASAFLFGWVGFFLPKQTDATTSMRVRIIATPPGPAPEEIRAQWIGLILPLAPGERGPRRFTFGRRTAIVERLWSFLTGPRSSELHYFILVNDAIVVLRASSPAAADWWVQN